ncbi:rCG63329 [Rattus norvegicus]|uniref:RCG63329 n=1 Tax=Rattus norvegicus TaxID=10116 RepID=A6JRH2_RAT|nr:rCG63329 [Rattus norvegicus]
MDGKRKHRHLQKLTQLLIKRKILLYLPQNPGFLKEGKKETKNKTSNNTCVFVAGHEDEMR